MAQFLDSMGGCARNPVEALIRGLVRVADAGLAPVGEDGRAKPAAAGWPSAWKRLKEPISRSTTTAMMLSTPGRACRVRICPSSRAALTKHHCGMRHRAHGLGSVGERRRATGSFVLICDRHRPAAAHKTWNGRRACLRIGIRERCGWRPVDDAAQSGGTAGRLGREWQEGNCASGRLGRSQMGLGNAFASFACPVTPHECSGSIGVNDSLGWTPAAPEEGAGPSVDDAGVLRSWWGVLGWRRSGD